MKKRICVIFTGGTIGSFSNGGVVDLNAETGSLLIDKYRTRFGGEVEFDTLRPLNILSENMQPDDLKTMEDCINNVDKEA